MKIKKYLIVFALIFPLITFAQTTNSTVDPNDSVKNSQDQIQLLQAQVVDLQNQVQSLKLELKFSRVLRQGSTGDDVKQLQEFLKTFTNTFPEGSIDGNFGPLTKAAVKEFQKQNGIGSDAIVGPKTQNKLNVLTAAIPAVTPCINCQQTTVSTTPPVVQVTPLNISPDTGISATTIAGCTGTTSFSVTTGQSCFGNTTPVTTVMPTTPGIQTGSVMPVTPATSCKTPTGIQTQFSPTIIKVLSPNGGEQWQIGETYTIKYSAKNIASDKALLIYLEKGYDAPSTKTGANSSLLIGVTTNLESYTYKVPQNIQQWPGFGSNYKITIMVEGSYSSCDVISYIGNSSDATFSIVAGKDNTLSITPATTTPSMPITPTTTTVNPSPTTYSPGCFSTMGYSTTTGQACDGSTPTTSASPITPSIPITPTIVTSQEKIANIQEQISVLQNQLNNTTDTATQNSLTAQIILLKTIIQEIQNQIFQGQLLPIKTIPSITQDTITTLQTQINAVQNQLNNTIDATVRDSLMAQIAALKTQVDKPQTTSITTSPTL